MITQRVQLLVVPTEGLVRSSKEKMTVTDPAYNEDATTDGEQTVDFAPSFTYGKLGYFLKDEEYIEAIISLLD